ncbi:MAG: DNA alkylation repair protein [Bacilli bacterium]|nr:DNA alkylation repair protein [Bacilli bacterium]
MDLKQKLFELKDDKYKEFQEKLVPNIPKESIIGVRTPDLRNIAKEIFKSKVYESFFNDLPHKYYEENLVHIFIISMIKDFDKCVIELEKFLPYMDCWPVSDQATLKVFKKNHEKLLPYVKKWIKSKHVYTSRFGIRMLMNEYLDKDFKDEYLGLVASIKSDDYYLKMMIAWYFATALAKRYDESIPFFENRKLDPWIHKKAIQKATESFRVSDSHKEYLKKIK